MQGYFTALPTRRNEEKGLILKTKTRKVETGPLSHQLTIIDKALNTKHVPWQQKPK